MRQLKDYITDQKSGIKSAFEDKVDPQDFEKIIDSRANDSQLQQDVEKLLQVVSVARNIFQNFGHLASKFRKFRPVLSQISGVFGLFFAKI